MSEFQSEGQQDSGQTPLETRGGSYGDEQADYSYTEDRNDGQSTPSSGSGEGHQEARSAEEQSQGGAYGQQQAEFSDAQGETGQGEAGQGSSFGSDERSGQSGQERVEEQQGGFYRDEPVEDLADEQL